MLAARRMMFSGTTALRPDQVSGLNAWWKADALSLANLAQVASWVDSSGNGLTMTQPTSGKQPIYHSAPTGFGSKPAVHFTRASDQWLSHVFDALLCPAALTVAAVVMPESSNAGNGYGIFSSGTGFDGNGFGVDITGDGSNHPIGRVAGYNAGNNPMTVTGNGSEWALNTAAALWATSASRSTLFDLFFDTTADNASTVNTGAWATATQDSYLGQQNFTGDFDGYIAEVSLWSRVLTTDEQAGVQAYFAAKYGI